MSEDEWGEVSHYGCAHMGASSAYGPCEFCELARLKTELASTSAAYDGVVKDLTALTYRCEGYRQALLKVVVEDINGYSFDKLMEDTKELLKSKGGWQNGYAISAIMDARDAARKALKESE